MLDRHFIGWQQPFLELAGEWLLARRERLAGWLVVVPTAASGRRLRQRLAEQAGALLSPRIVTPAWFLRQADRDAAPAWVEQLAWQETLARLDDWSRLAALFPEPPEDGGDWTGGLARELTRLRSRLQENGHTLESAAKALGSTVDRERWSNLAYLERLAERRLDAWGFQSRSRLLADGVRIPSGCDGIVLAGLAEMPAVVERAVESWEGEVFALIGAPDDEADHFSPTGRPLAGWSERDMPWPGAETGSVRVAADPGQQAAEAFAAVCAGGMASDDVALGSADPDVSPELVRAFGRGGWPAYDPGARPADTGLRRFLGVWAKWLGDPTPAVLQDLLALPESGHLVAGGRARLAETLSRLRDRWMLTRLEALRFRLGRNEESAAQPRSPVDDLRDCLRTLEGHREAFSRDGFSAALEGLLEKIHPGQTDLAAIREWSESAAPLMDRVDRPPAFWLEGLLDALPVRGLPPPDDRVIDVEGWLELFHEPGRHLVICGMNEGRVPASVTGDPWLGEAAAAMLGLANNQSRAARDAYLCRAMIEARRVNGRVDLVCGKAGPGAESLLPSRLLLAATGDELARRVGLLFREVEPPEAGLRWHNDWKWQAAATAPAGKLAVTSLAAWLACPFRFYLKHVLGMSRPEPDRIEWNQRDFGNVAHHVLEAWGSDGDAREFDKTEAIETWLADRLDRVVTEWFGRNPPLAVRIQSESLRRRLAWFARAQAIHRASGWKTIEVEHKFTLDFGSWQVVAKIDRIDRHRDDGRLMVVDYKTGRAGDVVAAHCKRITAATRMPAHLPADCPAIATLPWKGKLATWRWSNLQLPLYAAAVRDRDGVLPVPAYFTLGATEAEVKLEPWEDFSPAWFGSARACADWVVGRIAAGGFWPPADRVTYDDFEALAAGRDFGEMFLPPAAALAGS